MTPFLKHVAHDLIQRFGTNLSRVAVIFPNKRASLFLNKYLIDEIDKPMWAPHYITINELFRAKSSLMIADKIKAIAVLYEVYSRIIPTSESIDKFWGWGEVILADFDDIDKNLGNVDDIFNNVRDIHALDNIAYLDKRELEVLKRFFAEFTDDHDSHIRKRFEQLWNNLSNIYHQFNAALKAQNQAYESALYRDVVEE